MIVVTTIFIFVFVFATVFISIVGIVAGVAVTVAVATAANASSATAGGARPSCNGVGIECHGTAQRNNSARTLTLVVTVSLVRAIRFPTKVVPVPSVAELPICQNTLPHSAPFVRTTEELLAVVSVLPILKT